MLAHDAASAFLRRPPNHMPPKIARSSLPSLLEFVAFALILFPLPLLAHHGNAAYDLDNPIALKGTITEFLWANPHVQIYFDARNAHGKVDHWACETVSPGLLVRAGWKKDELKAGDNVTISIAPAKSGAPVGLVLEIKLDDGRDYKLGQGRDRPYP
jgi:hypothetical protein